MFNLKKMIRFFYFKVMSKMVNLYMIMKIISFNMTKNIIKGMIVDVNINVVLQHIVYYFK